MRVLVLTQYYPPENAFYAASIAKSLASRGHDVRVLTGFPNYPAGRLFDGYRQHWRSHETDGNIRVLRVPLYTDHSQSAARRLANYLSFGLSAATARSFARGADVIYVYATQMTPALGPWLWRLTGGAPYVLHIQDLWPDSITGSSLASNRVGTRLVETALAPWLSHVYKRAAAVIGIAPTMVETLVERGVPPTKAHLVYNWAEEATLRPDESAPDQAGSSASGARILYGGNVGDMQDLETVIRAVHHAHDAGIQLTVVGDGVALPRIRALAEQLSAANIDFRGRVPREQIGKFYRETDFALVTLKDLPTFRGTIPSKFQASLSHGVPVITNVQGDVRGLVDALGVGFTAEAEDVTSLEAALRRAAASTRHQRVAMATRARDSYREQFSQGAGVAAIEAILISASRVSTRALNGRGTISAVN